MPQLVPTLVNGVIDEGYEKDGWMIEESLRFL